MIEVQTSISNLIPNQFPSVFREQGPNFVAFMAAYYEWLESPNNALYYARNYYNITDIDRTFDDFLVYFKEKYFKNIQFSTEADTRQLIKHAVDLYRSKGTQRAVQLLFQLVFNKHASVYYPGLDLFRLSDGEWYRPVYLELTFSDNNFNLTQREIKGLSSGATAFVDVVARRQTHGRYQDVAYISALNGNFKTHEKIVPEDGSMDVLDCPFVTGSLNGIEISSLGTGQNYTVGDIIPITGTYGQGAYGRVANTTELNGVVGFEMNDGGYGYTLTPNVVISNTSITVANLHVTNNQAEVLHYSEFLDTLTEPMATLSYISANGTLNVDDHIFTYFGNGSLMGTGIIISEDASNSTAGHLTVSSISGNVANTFYTTGNTVTASLALANGYTDTTATGQFVANAANVTISLSGISGAFELGEAVYQPHPHYQELDMSGIVTNLLTSNTLLIGTTKGIFSIGQTLTGRHSGATGTISDVSVTMGVVNVNNHFVIGNGSSIIANNFTGKVNRVDVEGVPPMISIANTLLYPEDVTVITDRIAPYMNVRLNAVSYGFPANSSANLTHVTIKNSLSYANVTIGKLSGLIDLGGGQNFSSPPFIVIDEARVSTYAFNDVILDYTGASAAFTAGEIITQAATSARGLVRSSSNSSVLFVQRMSYGNNFIKTTNSTTIISGQQTGTTANVTYVDVDILSNVMGRNVDITSEFATGNGVIVSLDVVDSGFGYQEEEIVGLGSNNASGTTIINRQGTGSGYYKTKGGFLSDQKKLFDNYYWQNFSYEVVSSIAISKFEQLLNQLTHVAGTKMFGKLQYTNRDNNRLMINKALFSNTVPTANGGGGGDTDDIDYAPWIAAS